MNNCGISAGLSAEIDPSPPPEPQTDVALVETSPTKGGKNKHASGKPRFATPSDTEKCETDPVLPAPEEPSAKRKKPAPKPSAKGKTKGKAKGKGKGAESGMLFYLGASFALFRL